MGCVLSDSSFPCKIASKFSARIVTFDAMAVPLIKGSTGVLHLGTATEQVTVKRLISQLNKGTGEVVKAKPRCLPRNSNGIVELETLRPICIEEFKWETPSPNENDLLECNTNDLFIYSIETWKNWGGSLCGLQESPLRLVSLIRSSNASIATWKCKVFFTLPDCITKRWYFLRH